MLLQKIYCWASLWYRTVKYWSCSHVKEYQLCTNILASSSKQHISHIKEFQAWSCLIIYVVHTLPINFLLLFCRALPKHFPIIVYLACEGRKQHVRKIIRLNKIEWSPNSFVDEWFAPFSSDSNIISIFDWLLQLALSLYTPCQFSVFCSNYFGYFCR